MGITGLDRMTVEADRVEVRGGGGCVSLFGLLFLLAGCGAVSVFVFSDSLSPDYAKDKWVFAAVGLMLIIPGACLTFGRYRLLIDANMRTYRKCFSVLVPIKQTGGSLDEFDKVVIRRRVTHRDQKTYTDYPIQLQGTAASLEIAASGTLQKGRSDTEQVAKALRLPLADHTDSARTVREVEHLDESLRERRRRTAEGPIALPPVPEGMTTRCRMEGQEVVLVIPPKGCTPEAIGLLILLAVVVPGLAEIMFRPFRALAAGEFSPEHVFEIGVISMSMLMGVTSFLWSLRRSDTIRVTRDRLNIRTQGALFVTNSEISADELEELRSVEPKGDEQSAQKGKIIARSDRATIEFGQDLSKEERSWIKAVLETALTA